MIDKELQLKRAKQAVISRDYETAVRIYKMLINEDYNNINLKIELGNLYVKSGQDKLALCCFEEINKLQSGNIDVLLALGGIYRRLEQYEESIWALECAIDTGEKGIEIAYSLGFTYRQMAKYNSAIECFQSVVDQNPRDVLAFNHLGAIYALQGDHEKAIVTYQHGLKLDQNHPVLQLNLAKSYEAIGENKKALSCFEGALRSKPGWTEAIEAYASLLLKDNFVKEADEVVSRALKINPHDAKMHTAMGNVLNRKSIFDNAEKEFKVALSKDSRYSLALRGLAFSQEKQGKNKEASTTIQKATTLNPNDTSILKQSAHIFLSANFLPAAYEKISHLWQLNQDDIEVVNLLGQYYICHGDEDKIESCFDKIESIKPDYHDVYRDWGERFAQIGDNKNAEDYLKVAVLEKSDDSEARYLLAKLYEKLGRTDEALNLLGEAAKIDSHNTAIKKAIDRIEKSKSRDLDGIENVADINSDFEDSNGFNIEISMGEENPDVRKETSIQDDDFDMNVEEPYLDENGNNEVPIDFDSDAIVDSSMEYDSNRALENLIDNENDSVDSVLPKTSDDYEEIPQTQSPNNNSNQSENADSSSSENADSSSNENADSSLNENADSNQSENADSSSNENADSSLNENADSDGFEFSQFGNEDLSGDTDDIVSIDEIMSGDDSIDEVGANKEFSDYDEPIDEVGDSTFDANLEENEAEYSFEEEVIKNPHKEFDENPDIFKNEDLEKSKPIIVSDSNEKVMKNEEHIYDERHQPKDISNNEYLSIERQLQRVANSADNAAFTANQALRAAKVANNYAQNAEDSVRESERRINRTMDEKIEDIVDSKFNSKLDTKIEEKISEKIGDELNSKISETIDNFVVTPDTELYEKEINGEKPSEADLMLKKAVDMLPAIMGAIENKDVEEEFSTSLDMFKKLREMLEFLPPAKKKQFMTSRNRLMLDYIIAKLSGKPGLFATVSALLKSGVLNQNPTPTEEITSDITVDTSNDGDIVKLLNSVMENLKTLCKNLEDDYLRDALDTEILALLEKIKNN